MSSADLSVCLYETIFCLNVEQTIIQQWLNAAGVLEWWILYSCQVVSSSDSLPYLWGQLLQHTGLRGVLWSDMMLVSARPVQTPFRTSMAPVLPVLTFTIAHHCSSSALSLSSELTHILPWLIHRPVPLLRLDKLSTSIMDLCVCVMFSFEIPGSENVQLCLCVCERGVKNFYQKRYWCTQKDEEVFLRAASSFFLSEE